MDDQKDQNDQNQNTEPPMSGSDTNSQPEAANSSPDMNTSDGNGSDEQSPSGSMSASPAESAAPEAAASSKGSNKILYIVIVVLVVIAGAAFIISQKNSSEDKMMGDNKLMMDADEPGDIDKVDGDESMMEEDKEMMEGESMMEQDEFELSVEGGNFYFEPNEIRVKKGATVEISFKNAEGTHDFVLEEFGVQTPTLSTGDETDIEFVADQVGEFEFYCSIGNHREMGMVGTLIVTE